MVIYFSGTGNSRFAAEFIAKELGDTCLDSFAFIKYNTAAELTSETPWVFVCPTYAWRIPRLFQAFIERSSFTGCREAYFVMTCGDSIGDPKKHLQKLCAELSLEYMGTARIVMPENYIAMFNAPEERKARIIIKRNMPRLVDAAKRIRSKKAFDPAPVNAFGKMCSSMVNPVFYAVFVKDRKFMCSDACTGCGLCEKLCPLNNITLKNNRPSWNGNCTHCMACICSCPAEAIEYGKISTGKPRYKCPDM